MTLSIDTQAPEAQHNGEPRFAIGQLLATPAALACLEQAGVSLFDLIAHAAKTRELRAGTLVGTGTISNRDRATGFACIMEARMVEQVEQGEAKTPFLKFGDTVKIEMFDHQGDTIFGAIEQRVEKYAK